MTILLILGSGLIACMILTLLWNAGRAVPCHWRGRVWRIASLCSPLVFVTFGILIGILLAREGVLQRRPGWGRTHSVDETGIAPAASRPLVPVAASNDQTRLGRRFVLLPHSQGGSFPTAVPPARVLPCPGTWPSAQQHPAVSARWLDVRPSARRFAVLSPTDRGHGGCSRCPWSHPLPAPRQVQPVSIVVVALPPHMAREASATVLGVLLEKVHEAEPAEAGGVRWPVSPLEAHRDGPGNSTSPPFRRCR